MKWPLVFLSASLLILFSACSGEDRSGEQPFPPTVRTLSCTVEADSCTMVGVIDASPNSSIRKRGFSYGNDTLKVNLPSTDSLAVFTAVADSLLPGTYYAVAYATNGMGTSYGDTLVFVVP